MWVEQTPVGDGWSTVIIHWSRNEWNDTFRWNTNEITLPQKDAEALVRAFPKEETWTTSSELL